MAILLFGSTATSASPGDKWARVAERGPAESERTSGIRRADQEHGISKIRRIQLQTLLRTNQTRYLVPRMWYY